LGQFLPHAPAAKAAIKRRVKPAGNEISNELIIGGSKAQRLAAVTRAALLDSLLSA
jgi:hypothetical protein